jgi:hypothetical protein
MAWWAEAQIGARYYRQFGYPLPLHAPHTFREKLFALTVHMHRRRTRRYTQLSGKLAVRRYVRKCIGAGYLSRNAWMGTDPDQAPLEHCSNGGWIAKTNHGCGGHRLITAGNQWPLRHNLHQQLQQNYYWMALEAQYFHIQRQLYIEQLVQGQRELPPLNCRLWCFGGCVELLQVDDASPCNPFYSRNWELLDLSYRNRVPATHGCAAPKDLAGMLHLAEQLAAPFGFVRVNLYNLREQILFSEQTFTPLAGGLEFSPSSWDERIGALWLDLD